MGPSRKPGRRLPVSVLPRTDFRSGDADFFERGFRKRSFSRRDTFKPNSQRKTLTVDQSIHFVPLPRLVLPTAAPPFWPTQNCRPGKPRPTAASPPHPRRRAMCAKRRAKHLALPTASNAASKCGRGILVGLKSPSGPSPQYPENAFQAVTVRCPGATAIVPAALGLRQQRFNQRPLRIGQ
jgi:hypothetical protein